MYNIYISICTYILDLHEVCRFSAATQSLPHGKWLLHYYSNLGKTCLFSSLVVTQWHGRWRGEGEGVGPVERGESCNNNAFINCPADVWLSSRRCLPRLSPDSTSAVLWSTSVCYAPSCVLLLKR